MTCQRSFGPVLSGVQVADTSPTKPGKNLVARNFSALSIVFCATHRSVACESSTKANSHWHGWYASPATLPEGVVSTARRTSFDATR